MYRSGVRKRMAYRWSLDVGSYESENAPYSMALDKQSTAG